VLSAETQRYICFTVPNFKVKVDEEAHENQNSDKKKLVFEYDRSRNLHLKIPLRRTSDFLEWDPDRVTKQFKMKVYQISKFVDQKHRL
jgi:hypothetical protein